MKRQKGFRFVEVETEECLKSIETYAIDDFDCYLMAYGELQDNDITDGLPTPRCRTIYEDGSIEDCLFFNGFHNHTLSNGKKLIHIKCHAPLIIE